MTYTLNSVALDTVLHESVREYSDLDVFPLPMLSSDQTECYNFSGVTREITVKGKCTRTGAETLANLYTKIRNIGNVFNPLPAGDQPSATVNYVSDFLGTIKVYVSALDFSLDETGTGPCIAEYTLTMTEAAT
jgi:hypothetical protein